MSGGFRNFPPDPVEEQRQRNRIRIRDEVVRINAERRNTPRRAIGRIEVIERTGLTYDEILEALGQSLESWANGGHWVVGPETEKLILSGNAPGIDITLDGVLLAGRAIAIDRGLRFVTLVNVAEHFGAYTLTAVTQFGQTDRIFQGMIASEAAATMRTNGSDAVIVGEAIAVRHRAVSLVSVEDRRYVCGVMADAYTPA